MWPEITFDAPLGWVRVKTQKLYADIVAGGYTGGYDYPMGWKLTRQPKSGYSYLIYTPSWWNFLTSPYINAPNVVLFTGQDGKPSGITVLNKGLFNTKPNVGRGFMDGQPIPAPPWEYPPKAECLTSTGAIHKVLERKNGSTRIETFKLGDPAPDPLVYNHITTPWLLYTFMAVTPNDTLSYNWGNMNHIPLISVDGSAWIDDEKLEFLDDYPEEEPIMGTYNDLTNQGMINLFKAAFADAYWDVVTRAGLEWIAADRPAIYEGPTVGEMTLTYEEKVLLRDQVILAGYNEPPIAPPAGAVDTAQLIQILNNAKESGIATVDSIQTALDILQ